ncbi:maleylpyruvate isomerase family mycothiol-dependent enzyme [Pseudonocardia sp.]|uniref:maleylpyruvate isomerase family mycothiol-dependent enzyme n=1 Tax=Pseudonocardia sp. TaxID=60912 RepID=UPI003D0F0EB2
MTSDRDPHRAARLLDTERDVLLPELRRTPSAAFDLPTICTGWSVRDVLAHCAAALTRVANGNVHRFTPEDNEADVEERRSWPLDRLLTELERGYSGAAPALVAAGGRFDAIALGEWVHGGDVREPLGLAAPYASRGADDALVLLTDRTRGRGVPRTRVHLPGRELDLGAGNAVAAELTTDVETLVRLCAGRRPDPARYELTGALPADLLVFR